MTTHDFPATGLGAPRVKRAHRTFPVDVADAGTLADVVDLLRAGRVMALTGAGMSTGSGLPDYRGPDGKRRVEPMTYSEFVSGRAARQRYWARSYVGWGQFNSAAPNPAHFAVAALEEAGALSGVVTQNVDGLHQAAGSRAVIDLHGRLNRARCLDCGELIERDGLQARLDLANPGFIASYRAAAAEQGSQWGEARPQPNADAGRVRPDGDIDVAEGLVAGFAPPTCPVCGSDRVKPDVVFFGESVPKERVAESFALLERARAVLVLGSSLAVMSGYRFVRQAAADGKPVAIITNSATRGDGDAHVRIHQPLAAALPALIEQLHARP